MNTLEELQLVKAKINCLQQEIDKIYNDYCSTVNVCDIEDELFDYIYNNTQYVYHGIKAKLEKNEN